MPATHEAMTNTPMSLACKAPYLLEPCSNDVHHSLYLNLNAQEALTAGLESGIDTYILPQSHLGAVSTEWTQLGRFRSLFVNEDGHLLDQEGSQV